MHFHPFSCAFVITALVVSGCADGAPDGSGSGGSTNTTSTTTTTTSTTSTTSTTTSGGCVTHLDCSEDQICILGTCNLAWGRQYLFTVTDAQIAGTDPTTGNAWDPLGGAPDAFVQWLENGTGIVQAPTINDSFSPIWNLYSVHALGASQPTVSIYMWDEDTDAHDFMSGVDGTPAQWLYVVRHQNGDLAADNGYGTVLNIHVEPATN